MSSSNLQRVLIQIWAFVFKNWIIAKRNIFSLFEILFWPVVGFFSVGLLTSFLELDPNKTGFILVGIIYMSVIQICQIDVAYVLLYDLWSKSLKHTFVAPVQSFQLIFGSWLIGVIRSFFVFLLLSVLSSLVALICGIYYPVSILPFPLPEIAQAIPLTYFLAYFRSFYGFSEGFNNVLVWGFGLAGLYVVVEAFLFKAVLQRARRTGVLIKLSEGCP